MLRLSRYILALVLWLTFFFNIERLHVSHKEFIDIAVSVYVLAVVLIVLGLLLPQRFPTTERAMLLASVLGFAIVKLADGRPYWGNGYTYVTLFEFGAILISSFLAHRVGRLTADFSETVRRLIFTDLGGRVFPPDQSEAILKREMLYARRRTQPLSILLIEADSQVARFGLTATAQEIQALLSRRYSLTALARSFAQELRRSDFILDQSVEGRLVLVAPETRQDQAAELLERLITGARKRLGISLRCGIASFPDQGVTFEELMRRAEQSLLGRSTGARSEGDMAAFVVTGQDPPHRKLAPKDSPSRGAPVPGTSK